MENSDVASGPTGTMNQLKLLGERRFRSLFFAQFFGALNDNLVRGAVLGALAAGALGGDDGILDDAAWLTIAFVLPFLLFSGAAGKASDELGDEHILIRAKTAELAAAGIAAIGLVTEHVWIWPVALFMMGWKSAIFGPGKYAILPTLVDERRLVPANALVATTTFVAIPLGLVAGAGLIPMAGGTTIAAGGTIALALLGWLAIRGVADEARAEGKAGSILDGLVESMGAAFSDKPMRLAVLGVAWFWFVGSVVLSLLPGWTRDTIGGDWTVQLWLMGLLCAGVTVGALICDWLGGERFELGLTPFGSIGLTLFSLDLAMVAAWTMTGADGSAGLREFLATPGAIRLSIDVAVLSAFAGMYVIPLYAWIQTRADDQRRARVLAGSNTLNAALMLLGSMLVLGLDWLGMPVWSVFVVLGLAGFAVTAWVYDTVPEFLLRLVVFFLSRVVYRIRVFGREKIPVDGPAVLVANHISFVDWLLIASAVERPARFVMYHKFMKIPVAGYLFRDAKVIPIAPRKENEKTMNEAFDRIAEELEAGSIVCIFPEGRITYDGELTPFRGGVEKIIERTPVPVVPMSIEGMWGSFFSRKGGKAFSRPFRRFWSRVTIRIGDPVAPENVTAAGLAHRVAELGSFRVSPKQR